MHPELVERLEDADMSHPLEAAPAEDEGERTIETQSLSAGESTG
jgi:hypothetical protein